MLTPTYMGYVISILSETLHWLYDFGLVRAPMWANPWTLIRGVLMRFGLETLYGLSWFDLMYVLLETLHGLCEFESCIGLSWTCI